MEAKNADAVTTASPPGLAARFTVPRSLSGTTIGDGKSPMPPHPVTSAPSWRSSIPCVGPGDHRPPVVYGSDEVAEVRAAHALRPVVPLLREFLLGIADESRHLVVTADAEGTILWREGPDDLCLRADAVGLREGTRWANAPVGVNAISTVLTLDAPVELCSEGYFGPTYDVWTCAAAPIHDPDTGETLGVVDVSGLFHSLHPAVGCLVDAAAQLAEGRLRELMEQRDERLRVRNMPHLSGLRGEPGALLTPSGRVIAAEPYGPWPERLRIGPGADRVLLDDGREAMVERLSEGYLLRVPRSGRAPARLPRLSLSFLGDRPVAALDGRDLPLTLRWAELLAVLAMHPAGLTAEQLALCLYGDDGNPVTVRAEIHRLRGRLGDSVMQARPYRLRAEVEADFLTARAALRSGDVRGAAEACTVPLLAGSEAPAVRAERYHLVAALRSAALGHRDLDVLWAFAQGDPGRDDLEVFERLTSELPAHDPRRPVAVARLAWLLAEDAEDAEGAGNAGASIVLSRNLP